MTYDDQPSDETGEIRISRDTVLLLGALAFLVLAVILTFFFTPAVLPTPASTRARPLRSRSSSRPQRSVGHRTQVPA